MKKISVLILTVLFCIALSYGIKAKADNYGFEKGYSEIGYKEVNEAVQESEEFFKRDIALPTRLPPIPFTHNFGRFDTLGHTGLEITYLNEDSGTTHYKILVTSLKNKLKFGDEHIDHRVKLNDGSEAIYYINDNFDLLVFDKKGLQYILMVDKRISDKIKKEGLVEIANSIK